MNRREIYRAGRDLVIDVLDSSEHPKDEEDLLNGMLHEILDQIFDEGRGREEVMRILLHNCLATLEERHEYDA